MPNLFSPSILVHRFSCTFCFLWCVLLEADETALSRWRNLYLQGAVMQPEQRIPIFPGLQGDAELSAEGGEEGRPSTSCCVWHHVCVCVKLCSGWETKHSHLTKLLSCSLLGTGMWCCRALGCIFFIWVNLPGRQWLLRSGTSDGYNELSKKHSYHRKIF